MVKAFLGTGLLGSAFIRAALRRGDEVHVWNRTIAKAKALEEYGAKCFDTAAAAVAGAEMIHICLGADSSVDDVLHLIENGVPKNAVVIDHTTTSVDGTIKRTHYCKSKGITFLHAPVFMNPEEALNQGASMLISGNQDAIKKVTPELSKMTGKLINLGAEVGKSSGMKLMGNLFWEAFSATIVDMMTFANSVGFTLKDISSLFDVWNLAALAPARLEELKNRKEKGYDKASWNLEMARKDARLMIEASQKIENNSLVVISAIAKAMDQRIVQGMKSKDWEVIFEDTIKGLKEE